MCKINLKVPTVTLFDFLRKVHYFPIQKKSLITFSRITFILLKKFTNCFLIMLFLFKWLKWNHCLIHTFLEDHDKTMESDTEKNVRLTGRTESIISRGIEVVDLTVTWLFIRDNINTIKISYKILRLFKIRGETIT